MARAIKPPPAPLASPCRDLRIALRLIADRLNLTTAADHHGDCYRLLTEIRGDLAAMRSGDADIAWVLRVLDVERQGARNIADPVLVRRRLQRLRSRARAVSRR